MFLKEILVPQGDANEPVKSVIRRYNSLLLNETKKTDFSSTEAVTMLNRLLKFRKGQQENAAALPEVGLTHSMASLAAISKYLGVNNSTLRMLIHILLINNFIISQLTSEDSNFGQFSLVTFDLTQYVKLDSAAASALHLTAYGDLSMGGTSGAPRTLSALLNKCRTSCGQRLLAQWIQQPLTDKGKFTVNRALDGF